MESQVQVSIICLTYNHEKYIRECLEGFVSQKTDFAFEVLVHDDASTDATASIIREFEAKYPHIIKPTYQTENQYSKGKNIIMPLLMSKARGKYFAWCEGDDFWTDPYKLQKQHDALSAHPECFMCVAKTKVVNEDGSPRGNFLPNRPVPVGAIPSDEFLKITETYCFHTSTYFVVGDLYRSYIADPPSYRTVARVGDEAMILYFGSLGSVFFLDETVSCYRIGGASSWTVQFRSKLQNAIQHCDNMIAMNECFNEHTKHRFHDACVLRITRQRFLRDRLCGNFRALIAKEYAHIFRQLPAKDKWEIRIGVLFPRLLPWARRKLSALKNRLKGRAK